MYKDEIQFILVILIFIGIIYLAGTMPKKPKKK